MERLATDASADTIRAFIERHTETAGACRRWTGDTHTVGDKRVPSFYWSDGKLARVQRVYVSALLGRALGPAEHVRVRCGDVRCLAEAHLRVGRAGRPPRGGHRGDRTIAEMLAGATVDGEHPLAAAPEGDGAGFYVPPMLERLAAAQFGTPVTDRSKRRGFIVEETETLVTTQGARPVTAIVQQAPRLAAAARPDAEELLAFLKRPNVQVLTFPTGNTWVFSPWGRASGELEDALAEVMKLAAAAGAWAPRRAA